MSLGPACPACGHTDSDVVDSRFQGGHNETDDPMEPTRRRRRRCGECGSTFATHEVIDEVYSSRGVAIPYELPEGNYDPPPEPKRKTKRKVRCKVRPKALDAPRRRRINVRRDG